MTVDHRPATERGLATPRPGRRPPGGRRLPEADAYRARAAGALRVSAPIVGAVHGIPTPVTRLRASTPR